MSTAEKKGAFGYYLDGKRHRSDGLPAIEYNNGHKEWWEHGKLHRLDGAAIEYADDGKAWFINGEHLTESEFNERTIGEISRKEL